MSSATHYRAICYLGPPDTAPRCGYGGGGDGLLLK
uniref:Uncharacterized protein n=1 Tax=Nelumbo nucifera TaxID=4432 RepID=A0A822ZEE6_NELNU|nr:TPA_asm: hypothetical protein HUJ06_015709 [Nelumbo nucifera]